MTEVKSHMHNYILSVQLTWYIFFLQALFEKISMVIGEDIDDNKFIMLLDLLSFIDVKLH